jgi:hypothetical protein
MCQCLEKMREKKGDTIGSFETTLQGTKMVKGEGIGVFS